MLTIRRSNYNIGVLAGAYLIPSALGSTLLAGDILLYDLSQVYYGTVNAAGNAVVLATS